MNHSVRFFYIAPMKDSSLFLCKPVEELEGTAGEGTEEDIVVEVDTVVEADTAVVVDIAVGDIEGCIHSIKCHSLKDIYASCSIHLFCSQKI